MDQSLRVDSHPLADEKHAPLCDCGAVGFDCMPSIAVGKFVDEFATIGKKGWQLRLKFAIARAVKLNAPAGSSFLRLVAIPRASASKGLKQISAYQPPRLFFIRQVRALTLASAEHAVQDMWHRLGTTSFEAACDDPDPSVMVGWAGQSKVSPDLAGRF